MSLNLESSSVSVRPLFRLALFADLVVMWMMQEGARRLRDGRLPLHMEEEVSRGVAAMDVVGADSAPAAAAWSVVVAELAAPARVVLALRFLVTIYK